MPTDSIGNTYQIAGSVAGVPIKRYGSGARGKAPRTRRPNGSRTKNDIYRQLGRASEAAQLAHYQAERIESGKQLHERLKAVRLSALGRSQESVVIHNQQATSENAVGDRANALPVAPRTCS